MLVKAPKEYKQYEQVVYNPGYTKQVLVELGFKNITDINGYFRAQAIYRGGQSYSFSINKKTGRWKDFKTGQKGPLTKLPTLFGPGGSNFNIEEGERVYKPEIEQPKNLWDISVIKRLLPIYNFYKERGISEKTLSLFRGGLAQKGDLYNRFVFPIISKQNPNKVCGFSGRDTSGKSPIKWKHIGSSASFIYPCYSIKESKEEIQNKRELIICESIGDCLSLWEHGYKNSLVIFGKEISQQQIFLLVSLGLDKIIIGTNNDENRAGNDAAVKIYCKLSNFFPLEKMVIRIPPEPFNDFGDMKEKNAFVSWESQEDNTKEVVINYLSGKIKKGLNLSSIEQPVYSYLC